MRFVERMSTEPPAIFGSKEARRNRERVLDVFASGPLKQAQTRVSRETSIADTPEVLHALRELFDARCAFCETLSDELKTYRFRPAEGAWPVRDTDNAHLYYAWLAEAWQNLYPVCPDCMPENPFDFPVSKGRRCTLPSVGELRAFVDRMDGRWPYFPLNEGHILLDPCYDRMLWRHLRFLADGRVMPVGAGRRGRETIRRFRLDRTDLIQRRRKAFHEYHQQLVRMVETGRINELSSSEYLSGEYGGAWSLHLRDLLASAVGGKPSADIVGQLQKLHRSDDWRKQIDRARDKSFEEADKFSEPPVEMEYDLPSRDLRSISINNFKSIENLVIRLPEPPDGSDNRAAALLVLGENSTGKSTMLEAIALTLVDATVRSFLAPKSAPLVLDPRYMGAADEPRPDRALISIEYRDGSTRSLFITPSSPQSGSTHLPAEFATDGPGSGLPVFAYGAFRHYRDALRRFTPHKHVRSIFESDHLLSNPEPWLIGLRSNPFNMVARALREAFSVEGDFEVLRRIEGVVYVASPLTDDNEQLSPLSVVSSGFRSVLAMLCDIMQGLMDNRINPGFETLETARGLVLIDEVEAHLHPRWKIGIMTGLRRALPQVTFIATSHDPLCLRGMEAGEVIVLQRVAGGKEDTRLPIFTRPLADLPDSANWTIEQLLTADFFQLRSTASLHAERRLALMQDKLAAGTQPGEDPELREYLNELTRELPIGDSEVHRLVQEAVQIYLEESRDANRERLKSLRATTRRAIVEALRSTT